MPYLKPEDRDMSVYVPQMKNAGTLNYVITKIILGYVRQHGLNYQTCNDIMGAMQGAAREFYRRIVGPYENEKIAENGDVYPNEREYNELKKGRY